MAIKNVVAKGIGFANDGTVWIPTHGFTIGAAVQLTPGPYYCAAGEIFTPGAAAGEIFTPGASAGQVN